MANPYYSGEIIDFHTHPFITRDFNICNHIDSCGMSAEQTRRDMLDMGVTTICGSPIWQTVPRKDVPWETIRRTNEVALELKALYGDFYVPGFHVHPGYVKESCAEIERMAALGVRLVGELVPYYHGWRDYSCPEMDVILDCAKAHEMIVSIHSMGDDAMDAMVQKHRDLVIVAAHPGELPDFERHMERMKMSENYYLDLSGYGLFRHGMLRHAIDLCGAERILYGSDYPTCNPAMYLGGVLLDRLITEDEKKLIMAGNARRLLKL